MRFPKIFGNLDVDTMWDHKNPMNMLLKKIVKAFEPKKGAMKRGSVFALKQVQHKMAAELPSKMLAALQNQVINIS